MGMTMEEILKGGHLDPSIVAKLRDGAQKAGLTKRVIHIELDLINGNLKSQATPMDSVTHLGMIEFYKATILAQMIRPATAVAAPTPEIVVPPGSGQQTQTADDAAPAANAQPEGAPPVKPETVAPEPVPEGGAPSA